MSGAPPQAHNTPKKKGKKHRGDGKERVDHAQGPFRFESAGLTHVGRVRDNNEDAYLVMPEHNLYVVADGMGGHACGEVASGYTIESLRLFFSDERITEQVRAAHTRAVANLPRESREVSYHALRLRKAVESANLSVFRLAQQHESLRDMGTTIVATYFVGNRCYISHVGDSRVYRIRSRKIQQVTEDHSLVNEYLRMNILRPEDVAAFPYHNVIVRALGLHERVAVDLTFTATRHGDVYLLCSDGLTDLVSDDEICDLVSSAHSMDEAGQALVDRANELGGHDNSTVVLVRVVASAPDGNNGAGKAATKA